MTADPTTHSSVPDIILSLQTSPHQLHHVIAFFFKTREYRKLHEILKALIKSKHVIDDTCLRLYASHVSDLTMATACQTWGWFLGFKLSDGLLHLFQTFLVHITVSEENLVPGIRAELQERVCQTEAVIATHLQTDERLQWLHVCRIIGHIKLLYTFHGAERMDLPHGQVEWWDMSLVVDVAFDWEAFFQQSLSSQCPEQDIAVKLLILKLRVCDALLVSSESEPLHEMRRNLVTRLLTIPGIGRHLLTESSVETLLQSTNRRQDVQILAQVVVKEFHRKETANFLTMSEGTLNHPDFQTAVITSAMTELLGYTTADSDLHVMLSLLCDPDLDWMACEFSVTKEENKCWLAIREASELLMRSKESPEPQFTRPASRVRRLLTGLVSSISFPALLPLNQSRCLVVYSFLLLRWPEVRVRDCLIQAVLVMMHSLRSIWLLDFVPLSFFLLNMPAGEATQPLVRAFVRRVCKSQVQLKDFNDNIIKGKTGGEKSDLCTHLLQAYVEEERKESSHLCKDAILGETLDAAISKVLKPLKKAADADPKHFVTNPEHLDRLALLLRLHRKESNNKKIALLAKKVLRNIFSSDEILNNDEGKFLEAVCEKRQQLDAILSEEFMSELCIRVFGSVHDMHQTSSYSSTDARDLILRASKPAPASLPPKTVKSAFHANLIQSMVRSCNETECTSLLQEMRKRLVISRDAEYTDFMIKGLHVWISNRSTAEVTPFAADLVFDVTNSVRANMDMGSEVDLLVSSLRLTESLVRTTKWLSVNAVLNVTSLALHEIRKLGTRNDRVTDVASILLAVQAVLFQAIVRQQIAVITVMPYFNVLTSRLFRMCLSLCDEELLNTCSPDSVSAAEKCAQSVCTLLTSLSNIPNVQPFAATLVATYVHSTHSRLIHHRLKAILLPGVYRLVRAARDKDMQSLERHHVRMDQAGKDMLKQLTANYEHFFKYKGYV